MTTEFRAQPHDLLVEKMILGGMLGSPQAAARALSRLVGRDFYSPNHGTVFETIAALYEAREPTDVHSVMTRLRANGTLEKVGGGPFLVELVTHACTPSQIDYYVNQQADYAERRNLIDTATRIVQRAFGPIDCPATELTGWAAEQIASVAHGTGDALEDDGLTPDDLLADAPDFDWLIPGLLERGDRLMLTGSEGTGKSTLTRQIAVQTAAGVHPFTGRRFEGKRVLVVDCENGERLSKRRYNPLLRAARDEGSPTGSRLRVHLETSGLDLTSRTGTGWLLRRVERFKPDLLLVGPLYRLHYGDPNDERDARRVAAALDAARAIDGCGLILEAHSPHHAANQRTRVLRPVGSSLWLRWPEFGFGIAQEDTDAGRMFRVSDFKAWRGPRDERSWPRKIRAGNPWPWVNDDEPSVHGWT